MSDSSEDEDLSRFKEVVDISFTKFLHGTVDGLNESKQNVFTSIIWFGSIFIHLSNYYNISEEQKPKSERYLEVSSHYNDVKVPEKMQNQIGTKISTILNKSIEFVEVELPKIK